MGFTAAFFGGRVLSYAIYAQTAREIRHSSLGATLGDAVTSPVAIAFQVILIGALVWFVQTDWSRFTRQR